LAVIPDALQYFLTLMGGSNDYWFWLATTGAAAVVVAGMLVLTHASVDVAPQVATEQGVRAAEASSQKTEAAPTRSFSTPRSAARNDTIATVYECDSAGQRTFSDRRCAPNARERSIEAPSRMDPLDTSTLGEPVIVDSQPFMSRGDAVVDNATECAAIQADIDAIDARMREGYGSAEGEYLRARRRSLSDRYYELRCHHPYR